MAKWPCLKEFKSVIQKMYKKKQNRITVYLACQKFLVTRHISYNRPMQLNKAASEWKDSKNGRHTQYTHADHNIIVKTLREQKPIQCPPLHAVQSSEPDRYNRSPGSNHDLNHTGTSYQPSKETAWPEKGRYVLNQLLNIKTFTIRSSLDHKAYVI